MNVNASDLITPHEKSKETNVYTGEGKLAEGKAIAINTANNTVCLPLAGHQQK